MSVLLSLSHLEFAYPSAAGNLFHAFDDNRTRSGIFFNVGFYAVCLACSHPRLRPSRRVSARFPEKAATPRPVPAVTIPGPGFASICEVRRAAIRDALSAKKRHQAFAHEHDRDCRQ